MLFVVVSISYVSEVTFMAENCVPTPFTRSLQSISDSKYIKSMNAF